MLKKKKHKDYFIKMNMQNAPNAETITYYIRKADGTEKDYMFVVEGYEFTEDLRKDSFGKTEGKSPKFNFRRAYLPPEGHYIISRDFSGQEVRIIANLSGEETWVDTYLNDGDIHTTTAIKLFGEENFTKELRNITKAITFGLAYGMTEVTLSERINSTVEVAKEYIENYYKTHPRIKKMLDNYALLADKNNEVVNFYGRKRRFTKYRYSTGYLSQAGVRRAYNFPIQSLGADITITALIRVIYGILLNPEYKDSTTWLSTVHDEINITAEFSKVKEVTKLFGDLMYHELPNLPVPIVSGLDLGHSWGLMWEFEQDSKTLELTPVYETLSESEIEKQKLL